MVPAVECRPVVKLTSGNSVHARRAVRVSTALYSWSNLHHSREGQHMRTAWYHRYSKGDTVREVSTGRVGVVVWVAGDGGVGVDFGALNAPDCDNEALGASHVRLIARGTA